MQIQTKLILVTIVAASAFHAGEAHAKSIDDSPAKIMFAVGGWDESLYYSLADFPKKSDISLQNRDGALPIPDDSLLFTPEFMGDTDQNESLVAGSISLWRTEP